MARTLRLTPRFLARRTAARIASGSDEAKALGRTLAAIGRADVLPGPLDVVALMPPTGAALVRRVTAANRVKVATHRKRSDPGCCRAVARLLLPRVRLVRLALSASLLACEAPTVDYSAEGDEAFLARALGEWVDPGDPTRALRLCEDEATSYCAHHRTGICAVDGECHDIRGGGRGLADRFTTANGCEGNCARAAGVALTGELSLDGTRRALLGVLEAKGPADGDLDPSSAGYAPPYTLTLGAGANDANAAGDADGGTAPRVRGTYDGSTLAVTLDERPEPRAWTRLRGPAEACPAR